LIAALSTIAAPASGPATKLVTNDEKVAAAQKKIDELNAELLKRREFRAQQSQGTPEYDKARAAVQEMKPLIAEAEAALAAAQTIAPTVVQLPAGAKQHPLVEAVAAARAAVEQAKTQITVARADVERWNRAQAFMTVHRAELSYSDMKAKHEELVETAKDALRPIEMTDQQIAALEKAAVDGPAKLKEAEAALAQAQQNKEAAAKAVTAAEAQIAEKQKSADQGKTVEAEITTATKKLMELNAEIERRRLERGKLQDGTPEYAKANEAVQSIKPEIATAEKVVADAKAKLAAGGAPSAEATAAIAAAQDALKKAQAEAKLAADKVPAAEKAITELKKALEEGTKQLVDLKQKAPQIGEEARQAKTKAEQEAAAIAQKLDKAKAEAQQLRADFDAKWNKGSKAADVGKGQPVAKS
jgi:chromosome segregation ATPase